MVSLSLACGTTIGWQRIVKTIGERIGKEHLSYAQGASSELVAAAMIGISTQIGVAASTTHVLTSSIAGAMVASRGVKNINPSMVRNIALAWMKPEIKELLVVESVLEKHAFYLQLPYFLSPLFPAIAEKKFNDLVGYSYLYFRFTLEVDRLLDEQVTSSSYLTRLFTCLSIHEQAIQGLTQLFPVGNGFWAAFELCKDEYASTNMREKQMSVTRAGFSEKVYEEIASGKSAICYAIVHAMSNLSNSAEAVDKIYACLKHLHIAMQYLDDIQDFKQDWHQHQYTYTHFLVESYLQDHAIDASQLSVVELYQHCYTSGIAQLLLSKCHQHFIYSLDIASSLGLTALANHIQLQLDGCQIYQQEISQLLQKTKIKASKSFALFRREATELSPSLIQDAVSKALSYLHKSLDNQGCWVDFLTSAGQSKMWTTTYAGLLLAETRDGGSMAYEAFNASFHLPSSYNEGIMQDGDSTNFGMGLRRKVWGESTPQQINSWLAF
nr:hypothetical protein [Tanacetum cinerariifolium]